MTLEILKKLVALANNNSNEHEANSAARRVCIELAKPEFTISSKSIINPVRAESNKYSDPFTYSQYYDWYKKHSGFDPYYEEPRIRACNKCNKSKSLSDYDNWSMTCKDCINKSFELDWNNYRFCSPQSGKYYCYPDFHGPSFTKEELFVKRGGKIKLKCNHCGKERETTFTGPKEEFYCETYECMIKKKRVEKMKENANKS